jgi:plastocyanin
MQTTVQLTAQAYTHRVPSCRAGDKLAPVERERHPIRRLIALVVVVSGAFGLLASDAAATANVTIVFRAYQPPTTTVRVGETVTWKNSTLMPHTVTAVEGAFDSGKMNGGTTFSYTFLKPGTFLYKCLIHPTMKGTVIVTDRVIMLPTVMVHLSHRPGHPQQRLIRVQLSRPGARILLQARRGSMWQILSHTNLSAGGTATFHLSPSAHGKLRVVAPGPGGDSTLISRTLTL